MRTFQCIGVVVLPLLMWPAHASAQREPFYEALLPVYRALEGGYGDEGATLMARLDILAATVARWDEAIRTTETQLRARLNGADVTTAMQVHAALASTYVARNRFGDALREVDEVLRLDPTRSAFHRVKAVYLLAADRPTEAADAFRDAWLADRADPQNAYRLIVHRSARTTEDEIGEAAETLAIVERALIRGERGRADAPAFFVVTPIRDDLGGNMTFAPAIYARAVSTLLDGQFEAGIKALRAAAAADPLVTDAASGLEETARGIAALRMGQVVEAIGQLELAVKRVPQSSEAHRVLATAYRATGDMTQSLNHIREAIRLNRRDERSWIALAETLQAQGNLNEAASALRAARAELPDSGFVRWMLAETSPERADVGDVDIIASADRLVMLAGKSELYTGIAKLAQRHLDYQRALNLLQRRVALTPNDAQAHKELGVALAEEGLSRAAHAEFVIAMLLAPDDVDTLTAVGQLHLAEGRYDRAVDALEKAVARSPQSQVALRALGDALVRDGRIAEGQNRLSEAERLHAAIMEQQRRLRTAAALIDEAEVLMRDRQYDRAVSLWQQVLDLQGGSAALYLRLADALIGTKRFDSALAMIQKALGSSNEPDAHRRLAEVYAALGREQDSVRARQTYLDLQLRRVLPSASPN